MTWGKSLVVVTGASRGIGAEVCQQLTGCLDPGSVVLGVARDQAKLASLSSSLMDANPQVKFVPIAMDLATPDVASLRTALEAATAQVSNGGVCKTAMIVHNAGSLGRLTYVTQLQDYQEVKKYFDLNVSSLYPVNGIFLESAWALKKTNPDISTKVVNVSSLCALQPFSSWSLYCTAKAARDMLFRTLAQEEKDLTVLSYAPGPVDTDMQKIAREETGDAALRDIFVTMNRENKLLSPAVTVAKMLAILDQGAFDSGDHVDYYDEDKRE